MWMFLQEQTHCEFARNEREKNRLIERGITNKKNEMNNAIFLSFGKFKRSADACYLAERMNENVLVV